MAVPQVYRKSPRNVVASYTFFQYGQGIGYERLYAGASQLSGSTVYVLASQTFAGYPYKTTGSAGTTDIDFDLNFKRPQVIEGDAYVNFSYGAEYTGSGTNRWRAVVNIYHVRGATETLIGTANAPERTRAAGGRLDTREFVKVTLSRKKFIDGDKLRLNIIYTIDTGNNVEIWYDPESRDATTGNDAFNNTNETSLIFDIPVRTIQ